MVAHGKNHALARRSLGRELEELERINPDVKEAAQRMDDRRYRAEMEARLGPRAERIRRKLAEMGD